MKPNEKCSTCGGTRGIKHRTNTGYHWTEACPDCANDDRGWKRGLNILLTENDLVEIIAALKSQHQYLVDKNLYPEVRASIREIVRKCYFARQTEDNDPLREPEDL